RYLTPLLVPDTTFGTWHHFWYLTPFCASGVLAGELQANAVAPEHVRVVGGGREPVGEDHAQAALAARLGERLQHLAGGAREGVEGRRRVLVGKRDPAGIRGEGDPHRRVAAALVPVLHGV